MKNLLKKLFKGQVLTREEAREAMSYMISGAAIPEEIAAFLGSMAARGETAQELVGCVEAMRTHALPFACRRTDLIDVCGTGGDELHTFNISTTNALLLAAAGLGVVKHGNRAVSSQSGSADVLEKLGIAIEGTQLSDSFEHEGFVFLFAPNFHPSMKHVGPVRRALGLRTIFNMLGPLANPAPVKKQVIGVFEKRLVPLIAEALQTLGTEDALVVCGDDGLDEISLSTTTTAARVSRGKIDLLTLSPKDFGLLEAPFSALRGGTSEENAKITEAILQGEKGPRRDVVLLNASAALVVSGLAKDWLDGVRIAAETIDSGKAFHKLQILRGQAS